MSIACQCGHIKCVSLPKLAKSRVCTVEQLSLWDSIYTILKKLNCRLLHSINSSICMVELIIFLFSDQMKNLGCVIALFDVVTGWRYDRMG